MNITFCVFSSQSFLPRAEVCLESIRKHHPEATIDFNLVETDSTGSYVPGLARKRLERVKYLLDTGHRNVLLLGADCVFYKPLPESFFEDENGYQHGITLVPHVVEPPKKNEQFYPAGHANGDIVGFQPIAKHLVTWMLGQRIEEGQSQGMFYEQTLLSSIPFFSSFYYIEKDRSINYAYFNFHERNHRNGKIKIEAIPTIAQFSGYELGKPHRASKYYNGPDLTGEVLELFQEYENNIRRFMK